MKNQNNIERDIIIGKDYELVGKEKCKEGIVCYFVYEDDSIEGNGTTGIFFFNEYAEDKDLIIGHTYKFIKKEGVVEMFDFDLARMQLLGLA